MSTRVYTLTGVWCAELTASSLNVGCAGIRIPRSFFLTDEAGIGTITSGALRSEPGSCVHVCSNYLGIDELRLVGAIDALVVIPHQLPGRIH